MQTTYYTTYTTETEKMTGRRENIVDLTAYREKLERAGLAVPGVRDARDWTFDPFVFWEEEPENPQLSRREKWAIGVDMLASCAVVVMSLGFVLRIFVM